MFWLWTDVNPDLLAERVDTQLNLYDLYDLYDTKMT